MLARWVDLWFGFSRPVDRGTYLRHGLGLTVFKYAIDALLVWQFAGIVWTPLDYISPLLSTRQATLGDAPSWLLPLMVVIALPFLWIGVSMSMRRAVDAGISPGIALLFWLYIICLSVLCGVEFNVQFQAQFHAVLSEPNANDPPRDAVGELE